MGWLWKCVVKGLREERYNVLKGLLNLIVLKGVASLSDIYLLEAVAMNTMEDPKFERFLKHTLLFVYANIVV